MLTVQTYFDCGESRLNELSKLIKFPWMLSNIVHHVSGLDHGGDGLAGKFLACAKEYIISRPSSHALSTSTLKTPGGDFSRWDDSQIKGAAGRIMLCMDYVLRGTFTPETCLTLAHKVGETRIGNLRPFSR